MNESGDGSGIGNDADSDNEGVFGSYKCPQSYGKALKHVSC